MPSEKREVTPTEQAHMIASDALISEARAILRDIEMPRGRKGANLKALNRLYQHLVDRSGLDSDGTMHNLVRKFERSD